LFGGKIGLDPKNEGLIFIEDLLTGGCIGSRPSQGSMSKLYITKVGNFFKRKS
jgi:hypothetical protein